MIIGVLKIISKGNGRLGNKRMSDDHPDRPEY